MGLFRPFKAYPLTPKFGVEKSPFHIATERLKIVEDVNRAHLVGHFLALNLCLEQSYSFPKNPKSVNADRTH